MAGRARSFALIGVGAVAGVLVSVGISAYAFRDTRGPIPLEEIRSFTDVFGAVKANYVEPVDDKKLMHEAISGMLAGLDPHSAYLDADAFKDMQSDIQGEFGGLGIEVGAEEGIIKVIAPIDDTPAARAGIKAGDLIIKIDDKVTRGLTLPEAGPAVLDAGSVAAVRRLQATHGLVADGVIGPETLLALAAHEDGGPQLRTELD